MSIVISPAPDGPSNLGLAASNHREPPTLASVSRELDAGLLIVNVAAVALRAAAEPLARIGMALATSDGRGADARRDASAARLRLRELCASAEVNGINLLYADSRLRADDDRVALVSAVARDMDGCLTIKSIDIDRRTIALFDLAPGNARPCGLLDRIDETTGVSLMSVDLTTAWSQDHVDRLIRQMRLAQIGLAAAASRLSIVQSRISLQSSFIASLSKAGDTEPNALIDDTLSADATRKTALATQRLLQAQTHSIANTNRQTVLTLFKGE